MTLLGNAVYRIAQAMHQIAGAILILMMLVIMADVISRALFGATGGALDLTFIGGVEIVSYCLLFMVLFTLPFSVSRGQVIVDLFTNTMSERLKGILGGIYILGFGLLGTGMTLRFIEAAGKAAETGQVTQDLFLPLSVIYGVTAAATAVLALRGVLVAVQQIIESVKAS